MGERFWEQPRPAHRRGDARPPLPARAPAGAAAAAALGDVGGAIGAALLVEADAAFRPPRLLESRAVREPLFEHRLELAGYATRALELEGDGPPIVLLHGYADSADTWRLVLERLGREGRARAGVDLPGFGRGRRRSSEGPMLPQYDRVRRGRRRATPAEERGRPVVLAGNSLGGCIALRAGAARRPAARGHRAGRARGPRHAGAGSRSSSATSSCARCWRRARRCPSRSCAAASARSTSGSPSRGPATRPASSSRCSRATTRRPARSSALRDLGRAAAARADARGLRARADRRCRVLLVWGDRDRMVSHEGARHVLGAVPGRALRGARGLRSLPAARGAGALHRAARSDVPRARVVQCDGRRVIARRLHCPVPVVPAPHGPDPEPRARLERRRQRLRHGVPRRRRRPAPHARADHRRGAEARRLPLPAAERRRPARPAGAARPAARRAERSASTCAAAARWPST